MDSVPISMPPTREVGEWFIASCRRRDLSPHTIHSYEWSVGKLVSCCPEWPTEPGQVAPAWDSPSLGRVSRRDVERGIRSFLAWAERDHGLPNALSGQQRMPKIRTLPRVLEEQEAIAVCNACVSQQERAMVGLFLDTGIRVGELSGLHWDDVGRNALTVTGKTGPRLVPVSPFVREMLAGLGDSAHVWVSRRGPMSTGAVKKKVSRIFPRAGLRGPKLGGPHVLRHTFATHYIANGGNIVKLKDILGHLDISTTMIYVHLAVKVMLSDHAEYSPAARFLGV